MSEVERRATSPAAPRTAGDNQPNLLLGCRAHCPCPAYRLAPWPLSACSVPRSTIPYIPLTPRVLSTHTRITKICTPHPIALSPCGTLRTTTGRAVAPAHIEGMRRASSYLWRRASGRESWRRWRCSRHWRPQLVSVVSQCQRRCREGQPSQSSAWERFGRCATRSPRWCAELCPPRLSTTPPENPLHLGCGLNL